MWHTNPRNLTCKHNFSETSKQPISQEFVVYPAKLFIHLTGFFIHLHHPASTVSRSLSCLICWCWRQRASSRRGSLATLGWPRQQLIARASMSLPALPQHFLLMICSHLCGVSSPLGAIQTVISALSFTPALKKIGHRNKRGKLLLRFEFWLVSSVCAANKMLLWVGATFPYINTTDCSWYSTSCHTFGWLLKCKYQKGPRKQCISLLTVFKWL